jgi:hypothetical protein
MTAEKRQNAAFLLVSIAFARKHLDPGAKLDDQLLVPNGLLRAQRIVGLYDFTAAAQQLAQAFASLNERVVRALAVEREGFQVEVNNQLKRSEGFVDKQALEVSRIRDEQLNIRKAEERIKDLESQLARTKKLYEERVAHVKDLGDRIAKARVQTQKDAEDLRAMQRQLFEAHKKLADAAEINLRLERQVRELSTSKRNEP